MDLKLNSEYGKLKAVITHRPGHEIERLTPYNTSELLFEDVPFLEVMQEEHDTFTEIIRNSTGAQVFRLQDLLIDVLLEEELRRNIFIGALSELKLDPLTDDILARYSTSECSTILIAGIKVKELRKKFNHRMLDDLKDTGYIIPPCPNLYFMRDPAAVVQSGIIFSNMKFSGRQRESDLLRTIFENHSMFKDDYNTIFPEKGSSANTSIEGGDVIILSDKALAIGCSERTEEASIEAVAKQILKAGQVERIYQVELPPKRNFMHLDTVFTIIDENLIVTYPDAMESILQTCVYRNDGEDAFGNVILNKEIIQESITTVLKKEIPFLEVIETGDGNPDYSSREQWYDGANVFAISPRRVISYDRNKFTNRALKEAGVEVIETSSSELSRGLGGPRCMTMPLQRMH